MKKILKIFTLCFLIVLCLNNAVASGLLPDESGNSSCPAETSGNCGAYTLNDIVSTLMIASTFILGIVGSLALLMFTYGGVTFLISAGNSEKVQKAQQIIIGSVIGLGIVFASFTVINFAMSSLGISGWWKIGWF